MRNTSENYYEFEPVVQEMLFKDIFLFRGIAAPFSAEQNHLSNFGRGLHDEHFCEIILNLNLWFKRRCLKTLKFCHLELWRPHCLAERNHLCNFG